MDIKLSLRWKNVYKRSFSWVKYIDIRTELQQLLLPLNLIYLLLLCIGL
jgi:hypothetical protein